MAGKTQFTERLTVNLTLAQANAFHEAMRVSTLSKNDAILQALAMFCFAASVPFPKAEKRPVGRHKATRNSQGKFTKP